MTRLSSLSLEDRIRSALALIPPAHRLPPVDNEIFSSLDEGKLRLQNYAFTQGFALASTSFQKGKTILILDCTRHGNRTRNTRHIEDEDRLRRGNKVLFDNCRYRLRLKFKDDVWRLVVTNTEHSHELSKDPFSFRQHKDKDPNRSITLQQAEHLRGAGIKYRQALRALNIQGLRLSKDDYYNLARTEERHTEEEARKYALAILKDNGFRVRCLEKNIIESGQVTKRVIEHFLFCNSEQIRLARRFVSHFLLQTDTTFNTSRLNIPLSILLGITNTGSSFPIAYCYITSESRESFMFMFACMQELMFYNDCPSPYVLIGDFAAGLGAAMMKAITRKENPGGEAELHGKWRKLWIMLIQIVHFNSVLGMQLKL